MPEEQQNNASQLGIKARKYKNSVKLNSEGIVWEYFRKKNYAINLGRFITDEIGTPDFFVENGDKQFWVEVKKEQFTLSDTQISWMFDHIQEDVFLAITNEKKIHFFKLTLNEVDL